MGKTQQKQTHATVAFSVLFENGSKTKRTGNASAKAKQNQNRNNIKPSHCYAEGVERGTGTKREAPEITKQNG